MNMLRTHMIILLITLIGCVASQDNSQYLSEVTVPITDNQVRPYSDMYTVNWSQYVFSKVDPQSTVTIIKQKETAIKYTGCDTLLIIRGRTTKYLQYGKKADKYYLQSAREIFEGPTPFSNSEGFKHETLQICYKSFIQGNPCAPDIIYDGPNIKWAKMNALTLEEVKTILMSWGYLK